VNVLAALLAAAGFLAYTVLYGLAKRASHWGTVVGSVSGAMPVVVGYAAAAGHLDPAALALFAAMALWQMPHFYAIALYRRDEYAAAGVPVLPLVKGVRATKVHIVWYILAYLVAASFPTILGAAGYTYLAIVLASGVAWLWVAIRSFTAKDDARAARTTFRLSLVVVSAFSVALVLSPMLP
jgi:protoheme IX farnesyltransferase